MGILEVENLNKKFGHFLAVNDISFHLKEGEILGLLGPNGAGKTTTIQMLLGVLTPSSGTISYFGKNFFSHREDILEKVNFSSTYTNLPWNLTVKENLTYISYLYKLSDRSKRLTEMIEVFRLTDFLNMEISTLSAGQLTRVNLAKAFINKPKVLLLDEPTASLDPEVARYIRDFILEEQRNKKLSIIFTSHNMPEVEEVCDRVLFIDSGKIIADDTPTNLTRTIETCHIHFIVDKKDAHTFRDYCARWDSQVQQNNHEITVMIKEKTIPQFLQGLGSERLEYYEISIDKPNLEDYFLQVANKNKPKSI